MVETVPHQTNPSYWKEEACLGWNHHWHFVEAMNSLVYCWVEKMGDTDLGLVVVALSAFRGDFGQILAAARSDKDLV